MIGDTVNVAARLEEMAPVGEVAIGAATLRALSGAQVSPLGQLEVRGRREAIEAWRLEAIAVIPPYVAVIASAMPSASVGATEYLPVSTE